MVPHLLLGLGKKHLESTGPIGPDKGWAIQHPKYPTDIDDTLKYGFRLAIMSGASKDSTRPSPSFARSLHLCREWFSAKDATHGTDVLCDARKVSRDPICAQFATKHWVYRRALDSYTDEQQQKKQESQPKCSSQSISRNFLDHLIPFGSQLHRRGLLENLQKYMASTQ